MSKNKSLFYQFQTAISDCFSLGYDKHSMKQQKQQDSQPWRIFSFSAKSNLLDTAHSLSHFAKENFGVKQVKDISETICQEWLNSKAKSGCSISTLNTYQSNLKKLSCAVNHHFGVHTSFRTTICNELIIDKTTAKAFALSENEIERIIQSIKKPCNSSNFFVFGTYTSVRVNSVEKLRVCDLHFLDGNRIDIDIIADKGGRNRTISVENKEFCSFCQTLVLGKDTKDLLFGGIKKGSVNKWLNRRIKKLNIIIPTAKTIGQKSIYKSGNHSVRKASIQQYFVNQYRHYIEMGLPEDRAKAVAQGDCCVRLGHSRNRIDIVNLYLKSDC